MLARLHVTPPGSNPFGPSNRNWWETVGLRPTEALLAHQDLETIDATASQVEAVVRHLARLSVTEPWHDDATMLMHLPGFGVVNAMTVLSAIGTIHRFPKPSHLVAYSGLDPRVHQSGDSLRMGRISKRGRRELRTTMVQAAWIAVTTDTHWKARFAALEPRLGAAKAITAIARKMLVTVWHILTHREAAHHTAPETVARKYLRWASEHRLATSQHLSRTAFVQLELQRFGLNHGPMTIHTGGWVMRLDAYTSRASGP